MKSVRPEKGVALFLAGIASAGSLSRSGEAREEIDRMTPEIRQALAPTGTLRVGINLGNSVLAQSGPVGGEPRGIAPELGRELARRAGLRVRFATFASAGQMADAVKQDAWDVAFLAVDPARATDIAFSAPYVHVEGTYLVKRKSPIRSIADADREGVRIAVGLKTAYDLFLSRTLKHAQLVRAPTSQGALDLFVAEQLDAAAGVRQPLVAAARKNPDLRVLEESFMVIRQAAGVPRGRQAAAIHVAAFIEEAKKSGLVERLLKESGQGEVAVAPSQN
jgi:polar amino acid transport system substrate-binding protein